MVIFRQFQDIGQKNVRSFRWFCWRLYFTAIGNREWKKKCVTKNMFDHFCNDLRRIQMQTCQMRAKNQQQQQPANKNTTQSENREVRIFACIYYLLYRVKYEHLNKSKLRAANVLSHVHGAISSHTNTV